MKLHQRDFIDVKILGWVVQYSIFIILVLKIYLGRDRINAKLVTTSILF
jgi:hypothetical protein